MGCHNDKQIEENTNIYIRLKSLPCKPNLNKKSFVWLFWDLNQGPWDSDAISLSTELNSTCRDDRFMSRLLSPIVTSLRYARQSISRLLSGLRHRHCVPQSVIFTIGLVDVCLMNKLENTHLRKLQCCKTLPQNTMMNLCQAYLIKLWLLNNITKLR